MKKSSKLSFSDRFYWFRRNLYAVLLMLLAVPFYFIWHTLTTLRYLFITNGSEVLDYPWDWPWGER